MSKTEPEWLTRLRWMAAWKRGTPDPDWLPVGEWAEHIAEVAQSALKALDAAVLLSYPCWRQTYVDDRKIEQLKGNKALGDERANNGKALGSGVNAARAGMTQAELEAEYDEVFGFHVFKIGDRVSKNSGDYVFSGTVVAIFKKRSGVVRYVVEDERGLLLIMNEQQLKAPTGDGT